jgi:AraC-like DNA-binding protein
MLAMRGIDARVLLDEAGLPAEALRGEIIAPLHRIRRFVDAAAAAFDHPWFGLDLGERIATGTFGVTEFMIRAAPSVERGFQILCEFGTLINPIVQYRLDCGAREARFSFAVHSQRDALGCQLNEYSFAFILRQFAIVLGERLPIDELWFAHDRAVACDQVAARLGCPVSFGAADCGFAIKRAVLDRSPTTSDAALFEFLLAQARAQIANLGTRDMISQVARLLDTRLATGNLSAQAIAKAMAMTVRSLQRHLGDAGTTYRNVLKHVRQRRRAELARSSLSETEIARRLSFRDASSMRRSLDAE